MSSCARTYLFPDSTYPTPYNETQIEYKCDGQNYIAKFVYVKENGNE